MVDDDEGRTPDHGHPISSPCEPNGSGELKKKKKAQISFAVAAKREADQCLCFLYTDSIITLLSKSKISIL